MEKIGIEPAQLLTQVINFTLMIVILSKLLYKPILKILDERKKKIDESLKLTQKLQEEVEKSEKQKAEIIDKAHLEAKKIIEESKKTGKLVEQDIVKKAHHEAQIIVEKGKKEIDYEKIKMEKKLKKEAIEIATIMAEKILNQVLTPAQHEAIINNKLKDITRLSK